MWHIESWHKAERHCTRDQRMVVCGHKGSFNLPLALGERFICWLSLYRSLHEQAWNYKLSWGLWLRISKNILFNSVLISLAWNEVKLFGGLVAGGKAAFTMPVQRKKYHVTLSLVLPFPSRRIKSQCWLNTSNEKECGNERWSQDVESWFTTY